MMDGSENRLGLLKGVSTISFPCTRDALWDRTPLGVNIRVMSSDFVPKFGFSNTMLHTLRTKLLETPCATIQLNGSMIASTSKLRILLDKFSEYEVKPNMRTSLSCVNYINESSLPSNRINIVATTSMAQSKEELNTSCNLIEDKYDLTTHVDLQFDTNEYEEMIREFMINCEDSGTALLTKYMCTKLRICTHAPMESIALHGEIIVPSYTLNFTPIKPIGIQNTVFSTEYMTATTTLSSGFITLDQFRNIVPLYDNDPYCSMCPLVGIWITCTKSPQDSFVWSNCLRFLHSRRIRDRVTVEPLTFLVWLVHSDLQYNASKFFECHATIHGSFLTHYEFGDDILLNSNSSEADHWFDATVVRNVDVHRRFRKGQRRACQNSSSIVCNKSEQQPTTTKPLVMNNNDGSLSNKKKTYEFISSSKNPSFVRTKTKQLSAPPASSPSIIRKIEQKPQPQVFHQVSEELETARILLRNASLVNPSTNLDHDIVSDDEDDDDTLKAKMIVNATATTKPHSIQLPSVDGVWLSPLLSIDIPRVIDISSSDDDDDEIL